MPSGTLAVIALAAAVLAVALALISAVYVAFSLARGSARRMAIAWTDRHVPQPLPGTSLTEAATPGARAAAALLAAGACTCVVALVALLAAGVIDPIDPAGSGTTAAAETTLRVMAAVAVTAAALFLFAAARRSRAGRLLGRLTRGPRAIVERRRRRARAAVAEATEPARLAVTSATEPARRRWRGFSRRRRAAVVLISTMALSAIVSSYVLGALGATYHVNDQRDLVDRNVGDGLCDADAAANAQCTLRAAIQEANARPGADLIRIDPGTYQIGIAPINENAANVGDYEILDPVTIEKVPDTLGPVIIDGGNPLPSSPVIARGLDRLFEIHPGAGDVTLRNVIIQNGYSPEEGGAIQNWSLGKLTLDTVTIRDSYAEKAGGGLNHADLNDYAWATEPPNLELLPHGRVEIRNSIFTGNGSGGGSGAAINNVSGGVITIADTTVTLNPGPIMPNPLDPEEFILVDPSDYPFDASAIVNQARWGKVGTIKISGSTISLNAAEGGGAGIANWGDSIVTIENSTITQNRTAAEGGGLFTEGGTVTVTSSTISRNQAANGGGLYSGGHVSQFGLRGSFVVRGSQVLENLAENGGGIYNDGDAQLIVSDSSFARNRSSDHGAAISSGGRASMTLTRVTVTENESNGEGGGVWTHSERLQSIVDSTFSLNRAGVPIIEDGVLSDDVAGGGALHTDGGTVTILGSKFDSNSATEEGGALSIHNLGDVKLVDSAITNNRAWDGGGMENSATRVTLLRVLVSGNRAGGAGGGIYNTSSGEFHILDTTIRANSGVIGGGLANAPDNAIIMRGSLIANNTARLGFTEEGEIDENAGRGGGIMSFADGDSLFENVTISGNKAAIAGGGVFHDADGELRLMHATIWRNSAPVGGGIGVVESDFSPPIPPTTNEAVVLKNSIVGGSLQGGNCDWYIRSEGGNLESGPKHTCFLAVTEANAQSPIELGVRDRMGDPDLWALADNGGPTLTHALQWGSLAIDSSEQPCSVVDQRGVERPQNGRCDAGAYEFVGDPPPFDDVPPDTEFNLGPDGPVQDSIETMAFRFRGTDNITPPEELQFECRFMEQDLAEEPEIVAPWDPVPPELMWNGCSSPWSVPLPEEGLFVLEIRAIDRAGNIDQTPVEQLISDVGMVPPETRIIEAPGLPPGTTVPPTPATTPQTNSRSALFSFRAESEFTPSQFAEYECRLDSRDPEMWLECFNPVMYSDLTTGLHTFEVRAIGTEAGGPDPTPARYTWRVGPDPDATGTTPLSCDQANVTLTPSADGWVDQVNPLENYLFQTELTVRSSATIPDTGPTIHENARAFFRFPLTSDAPDCVLESASLFLYSSSHTEGRTLLAVPLAATFKESTLTWVNQPATVLGAAGVPAASGEGYREFDVTDHVAAILAGTMPSHGWVIRDQSESDPDGGDQSFISREQPQDPPEITLPELELRFVQSAPPVQGARDETLVDRSDVACGEFIYESTRLTADVTGCLGEGIVIAAPDIILDLNGHVVSSGLLLEPGEEDNLTPGIRSGQPNVLITGGTVTNFGYGVLLGPNSVFTEVTGMMLTRNALTGLQLFDADNGRNGPWVHHNVFDSNGETGLQLMSGTEGATIEHNEFYSNGMSIHVFDSHRNLIRHNKISGIILDPALDSDAGIVLENGSRGNVLEHNDVSDTGDAGIVIHQGSHGNSVTGGILVRNGDAGVIVQDADRIVIDGVLAHQQSDGGVVLSNSHNSTVKNSDLRYNPSGVDASNTNRLVVHNNDVSNSLQAGIELGDGVDMVITSNTASHTGGSGISVEAGAFDSLGNAVGGALVEGNTANQNAEQGLSIAIAKHTIRNNTANNNAGYGILAGEEVAAGEPLDPNRNVDGGGNRASGNHSDGVLPGLPDAVQCLGVICGPGDNVTMAPEDLTSPVTTLLNGPLGAPPAPVGGSTGNETARFEFTGTDNVDPATALTFECRLDAPPDPAVPPEEPDLEPPDPNDPPDVPEPPEGELWAECVSPHTYLMLEPGVHAFEVRAVDVAGNFDLTPERYEWTIIAGVEEDGSEECGPGETLGVHCLVPALAPDTRITAAPGELITDEAGTRYDTTNRNATFRFVGSDNRTAGYNLSFECRVHYDEFNDELTPADMPSEVDLPFQPCLSPLQYSNLAYGGHIFEIRSIDLGGNRDVSPAWHSWWIHPPPPDTTPPDAEILTGPDAITVLTSATFTFAGSDNQTPAEELAYQCRLDGADPWVDCTSPHTVTVSSPTVLTEHVLQVRAVDLAGNLDDVNGTVADALPDGVPAAYVWNVGPAPVSKTVFCGQKVTQSIKLNNNLGDCLGHGLIVGADNITIDLNGKSIDGKSIGAAILNNGYDSVTIRNGRLTDFDYGVMLNQGAKLNIIEGVTVDLAQEAAVALGHGTFPEDPALAPSEPVPGFQSGVDGNLLRNNTLVSNKRGVWLLNGARDNVVRGNLIGATSDQGVFIERAGKNLITGNDIEVASKGGVVLEGATDNTVRGNSIESAGIGVLISATTAGTTGIESTGNLIEDNLISDSAGPSLEIDTSSQNQLINNVGTLSDSYAIELFRANDNVIRGNEVGGNKGGISLKQSAGNTIEGNDASDSDSTGITIESQSFNNLLLNNISSNNVGGGIYIGDETPSGQGTLVQGNTTNSNKGMGIQASKPSHIFKNNVAMDNDSWGIHAGDPSGGKSNIDGGGNIAQGNKGPLGVDLKPQQCYNVTCLGGGGGGDEIAPNTSILEGPIQPESTESLATFRFSGADNASPITFECRFGTSAGISAATWQACSSPKTYSNLVNETYVFEVRAVDISNNADDTPASYTWAVVLGDFAASIDSTPDRVTVDTSATFEFSSNRQSGVTFQCLLVPAGTVLTDLWATAPGCTSPKTYSGLTPGDYEFWVRATDASSTFDTRTYAWTVGPAPVSTEVACGQILTQSTRLLNDLVDCGGYALIVGAGGITIDLDGHVIDGLGLDAGILNNGHDDVTIRNGLISQFLYGVQLNPGTARNVVHSLRIEGNEEAGIALSDADQAGQGNTIRDNSIVGNELGIALYSGTRHAVIRGNTLGANQGEGGIYLEFASQNLIEGNRITLSGGSGVFIIGGGENTVSENLLKDNGGFGVVAGEELLASNNNLIQRNTVQGSQGGFLVGGDGNTVLNNSVTGSLGPGVVVELATNTLVKGNDFSGSAAGISVGEATGTTIVANNASGTLGSGIEIGELSQGTVVRDNTTSGNGGDGIEVTESSIINQGTLVENNTADANGGDGIYVEGAGHTIRGNVAQLNGGWGIYSVGGVDGGGNFAAGNMEPEQCFGVVCALGLVPGAPETWIVSGPVDANPTMPGIQTNSRNASFTYMGSDTFTPLNELVFECRVDSTNPLAWEDCEYPAEYLNLSPGSHTFEVRAIDMMGQGLADPTPAKYEWTYVPLPTGVAPEVILDVVPSTPTILLDVVFTFHSNEPDVTFQCRVDTFGWAPCGFESATFMSQGAYEWALAENEVGPHTFYVRAIDFEGNVGEPATYTWELLGINVVFTSGPGFTPAVGGPQGDPATGGPTSSTSAAIEFEAILGGGLVADVQFWCRFDSLDPADYFPCESPFLAGPAFSGQTAFPDALLAGDHVLEVFGESETVGSMAELEPAVYEWEVVDPVDSLPPDTSIERAPGAADLSSTIFEFSGTDDLTPEFLLTFQCQVTNGTAAPIESAWVECLSPFNLLDVYSYEDPEMLLTQHTFWVRAVDTFEPEFPDPTQPEFEGNVDPTPASHTWTPVADTRAPAVTITGGPADGATIGPDAEPYTFSGTDNATPQLRLEFECAAFLTAAGITSAEWAACDSPQDIGGLEPGAYTFAVRALDLAGNSAAPVSRTVTVAAAPIVTFVSGPLGRLDTISGEPALPLASTENAVFTFQSDQPGSTFQCSFDGSDFLPCGSGDPPTGAAWVVDSGEHGFAVRATNPQGIVGEEAVYEWFVELAPDATEPNSTITSGPENGTLLTVATFTFSGLDNRTLPANLGFECALDSTTSWNSCVSPQQFSDLTRGSHTLRLRAIDAAGNVETTPATYTWIVAPPPVSTILSGPGVDVEESTERSATFTFSADVSPVTFHCWLDGKFNPAQTGSPSQPAPCTSGVTYENLGLGEHLFAVRAVDQFGNVGQWEDSEFRVMPSEARITAAPVSGTSTTATFRFTSEPLDAGAVFYCSLDERPFALCTDTPIAPAGTYEKTYTNLWPGQHTFQVQTVYTVLDWTGQPFEHEPIPAVHTWTVVDLTPPETTIDFGPPATTLSTSAYFQVSSDDPTATIECTLNGQSVECEPGVVSELTDLVPGSYTLSAVAIDLSGNVDPSPATYEWTIGTPSGPLNTPVGENVVVDLGDVSVTYFSVETAGMTTADQLGGGPSLPEGYGGASSQIYDISTTALYTEPITVCISYDPADFGGGSPSVRLLHFEGDLWLDVTTLNNPFSSPARVCSNVVEGFSLFAVAIASTGMAPETYILSGPEGPLGPEGLPTSTSGSATFEFWTDQPNAIVQCSLDGDPWFFCESPVTVGPLAEGDHEFLAQAVNEFGWMDLTPAIYEWAVLGPDVTPPTTRITGGPPEGSSTPNYISVFTFSGTDDFTPAIELDFECTLDGLALGGCDALGEEIEVTTAGPHTLIVQAIDEAGNIDPAGAVRNWTVVDMSGPDTEVLTGPEEETEETTAVFTFEGFELLDGTPVSEFECALDGGDFGACPGDVPGEATYSGLGGGAHVFQVRAVDPDGNRDISPAFWEWLIVGPADTTPPETYIVVYPDPANSGPDVTFAFASNEPTESFECSWGTGTPPAAPTTWEQCEAVWLLEALGSGQHWLWVRAVDAALTPNTDPTPAGQDRGFGPNDTDPFVWITTGEPDTIIDSGPSDPTGEYTAIFEFHSEQAGATFQCSVNGSPYVTCESGYQAGPFLPGEAGEPVEHEFEVRAVNQYRNADGEQVMDLSPAVHTWTVQDVTGPETFFVGAEAIGPEQFLDPGLRFVFRGMDDLGSSFELEFECAITNTTLGEAPIWEQCGEPGGGFEPEHQLQDGFFHDVVFADLAAGEYTFQVRAIDIAGNHDQTPAPAPAHVFGVEAEPETTILSSSPDMGLDLETTATSVTFTFEGTGVSFLCALDSTTFSACTSPQTYNDIPYGEHLFQVIAVAQHGTPDLSPAEFEWVSGTDVAPDVTIDALSAPPATGSTATSGSIAFGSTDPEATFLCRLDGGPVLPCTSPFEFTDLLAGEQNAHAFEVTATKPDLLPSVALNTALHEWVITDDAAPVTTLLAPLPTDPSGNEVTFTFAGTDNGTIPANLEFECRLDAVDPWVGCSSPHTIPALSGGEHTFEVRAIDEVPLTGEPASHTWNVIAPPLTVITNEAPVGTIVPAGETTDRPTGELSFSDQPGSTYECRLDPIDELAAWAACTSPYPYSDLSNGTHLFEVRATTQPVNGQSMVESPPAEYEWTIAAGDVVEPNSVIQLGPVDGTTSSSATFLFTGTDNASAPVGLTFECTLDGVTESCESGVQYAGLSVGTHTFSVRATDEAGNVESTPAAHSWTVAAAADNTPAGAEVEVLVGGGSITFANVTVAGVTSVDVLTPSGAVALPAGYLAAGGSYYEVSTTATFVGDVIVCLPYDALTDPQHLLHFDGSDWVDVTLEVQGDLVCGVVSSLSPFAVVNASATIAPQTAIVQSPADPTVQSTATGSLVQFQFTSSIDTLANPADFECNLDDAGWSSCDSPYQFEASFGGHTLLVRALTNAGVIDVSPASHSWTVLARPVATIASGPADEDASTPDIETDSQSATFEFSSDQAGSTFECRLTGENIATGWEACESGKTYSDLAINEEYTFEVQAIKNGNASFLPAQFEWQVLDLAAPRVTITGGPTGTVDQEEATFTFTADEPVVFECSFDGVVISQLCSSPITLTGLGLGEHTLTVVATDLSERENVSAPESRTFTVADLTAPDVTINAAPDATTSATTAQLSFGATDNWSASAAISFACSLDGAAFAACTSPQSYAGLSAAEHTFAVRATDAAGNADTASHTWTVEDVNAPSADITSMTGGSLVLEFTGTDDHTASGDLVFECRVDTAAYSECTSPKTYSDADLAAMTPGQHTFDVRAIDEAGNVGQPDSRAFTVADTKAPDTSITAKPAATTTSTSASFSFSGSDDGTPAANLTFECSVDGSAFAACTSPKGYSGLAVGGHTFAVRATDAAGNTDSSPASYGWTVTDSTAPDTSISGAPAASTAATTASFNFSGSDDVTAQASLAYQCSLDGSAFAACTSPKDYSGLAAGQHTFRVRAVDAAGNVDDSPASHTWTVLDTTAPDTSITGQPQPTTTNTSASFTFTGSDNLTAPAGLTYECSIDGGAYAACTSPKDYTGLAVGSHTFAVRATDAAGNTDGSAASYSWTIQAPADTTAPDTSITAQPPAATTETSASFSFTGTDNVTPAGSLTFECKLDAAAYAACTSPVSYSSLAVGSHTFTVRARDAAGNLDASAASYSWSVQSSTVDCGAQQTLTASADAWIDAGSTTSNKGSDSILKVMSKSGGNLRALVRFNLPAMPQGCSVESATLRIYAKAGAGGRTLEAVMLGGSWTEGAVTWANQPTTTGSAVTTTSGTGYREWNVGGLVQAQYTGTNNGFLIRDAVENQDAEQQFHSREESTNRPQLVLKFGTGAPPPPPPGSTDTTPPETTITGSPGTATSSTSATFTFSGTDNVTAASGLLYECQLDGSAWTACTSPLAYSGLAAGAHTFRVRARDEANNVDGTPAVHNWTIDQVAPETLVTSGPSASTTSTDASFQFTSSETGSTFECSLDGSAFASCTSPKTYTGLAVGSHSFQVRAKDAAGNVDSSPATYPWTVQSGGTPVNCGTAQTVAAVADSWIDQGSQSSNKGSDGILKVMSKSGGNLRGLVRFNLPSMPSGCEVDSATLRLYAGSAASGRTLQAIRLNASWTEGSVTWGNQPATTGSAVTTTSGTGYRQWNVAGMVQAMYSAGVSHGFLVRDANEGQDAEQQFFSREKGESPPQLVVTFRASGGSAGVVTYEASAQCPGLCETASQPEAAVSLAQARVGPAHPAAAPLAAWILLAVVIRFALARRLAGGGREAAYQPARVTG